MGGATPNTAFLQGVPGVELTNGRIVVDPQLPLPGLPNVFAVGDAALTADTMAISGVERQAPYLVKHLKDLMSAKSRKSTPY